MSMPTTTSDHSHGLTYPAEGATGWFSTIVTYHQAVTDHLDDLGRTSLTMVDDANDNEMMTFTPASSAVNYIDVANAATGSDPSISAAGDDTNIDLALTPKGTGQLVLDGLRWPNADGTSSQVLQTDGAGNLSWAASAGTPALNDITDVTITGASKGDVLVYNGSAWVDVTVGANDTVLTADSAESSGVKWSTVASSVSDLTDVTITGAAKGDILVYNGSAWVDLTVGTNGHYLTANSAEATGLEWVAAGAAGISDVVDDTTPQLGGDLDYNGNQIVDASGNEVLGFASAASAVNYVQLTNSATGTDVLIDAVGDDTNIDLAIAPKGTGQLVLDGLNWPTADGTSSQVLQTDGAGQLSFATASGGGDYTETLLLTGTASSSSSIDFTSNVDTTYKEYVIRYYDVQPSTSATLGFRFSDDGGSTWYTTNYQNANNSQRSTTTMSSSGAVNTVYGTVWADLAFAANDRLYGEVRFAAPSSTRAATATYNFRLQQDTGNSYFGFGAFYRYSSDIDFDAVQFVPSTGTIASGTFKLYGISYG